MVGLYFPINFEIDCSNLIKKFQKKNYKISFPIIRKNKQMDFFECSSNNFFYVNKLGIPEPYKKKSISRCNIITNGGI